MAHQRNALLDAIRAISALVVMVGHTRNAILPDFHLIANPTVFDKVFYLISGMGHQAVMVFFVLSGYLVGGAAWHNRQRFSTRGYAVARLSRLWTTVLPALALTALADALLLSAQPGFFQSAAALTWHSSPSAETYSNSGMTALANALFLQTISAPTFGSNGPLWSLANEAWYYAIFALVMLASGAASPLRGSTLWRVACAGAVLLWCLWVPAEMALLFIPWLMGMAIHIVPQLQLIASRMAGWAALILMLALLVAARTNQLPNSFSTLPDLLLGFAVALWLLHVHQSRLDLQHPWLRGPSVFLSEISFSLYVIHMPLVFLFGGLVLGGNKIDHAATAYLVVALVSIGIVLTSGVFWWLFERNTPVVKTWMLKLISSEKATLN